MGIQAKNKFRGNKHLNGNKNHWKFQSFRRLSSSPSIFIILPQGSFWLLTSFIACIPMTGASGVISRKLYLNKSIF